MDGLQRMWRTIVAFNFSTNPVQNTLTVGLCVFALLAGLLQRVLHEYKTRPNCL